MSEKAISLAAIGCGSRTRTYLKLAAGTPEKYRLVAAADPVESRVGRVVESAPEAYREGVQRFASAEELLAAGKLADVVIIGTQDSYHFEPCKRALELGYDVLLEKPIAKTLAQALELRDLAVEKGRRVMVCHVLRYTPFYRKVREIVRSGQLGDVVSVSANEGVEPWHFVHSFVRGHWGVMGEATPMMVAKCCHDMDIIPWVLGKQVSKLSSFGGLSHFTNENATPGRPLRCVDWEEAVGTDPYDARKYAASDEGRRWLSMIYDRAREASEEEIYEWLKESQWGRDAYQCENDQPDHQVLAMKFADGATGTFTMTAFEEGRHIEIFGTKGRLRGGHFYKKNGPATLQVTDHFGETREISIEEPGQGYEGHGGGDEGLVADLYKLMTGELSEGEGSSIEESIHSHLIAFASEHARRIEEVVGLEEFEHQVASGQLSY